MLLRPSLHRLALWRPLFRRRLLRFLRASIPIRLTGAGTAAADTPAAEGSVEEEGAAAAGAITGGISFRRNTSIETTSFTELVTTVSTTSNRQTTPGPGRRYRRLFGRSVQTSSVSNCRQSVDCDNCTVVPSSKNFASGIRHHFVIGYYFVSTFRCLSVAIYFRSSFQFPTHARCPGGSLTPCRFIYFP